MKHEFGINSDACVRCRMSGLEYANLGKPQNCKFEDIVDAIIYRKQAEQRLEFQVV